MPWPCRWRLALVAGHVWSGCLYAAGTFKRAVLTSIVVVPLCGVPVALLLNVAGEVIASRPHEEDHNAGQTQLGPVSWTSDDVEALAGSLDESYYAFISVRVLNVGLGAVLGPFFWLVLWRGWAALPRGPTIALGIAFPTVVGACFSSIWLVAEGYVSSPLSRLAVRMCSYGLFVVPAWLILLSGMPGGDRRRLACQCFMFVLPFPCSHFVLTLTLHVFFTAAGFWMRFGCFVIVGIVRAIGMHVAVWTTGRFTDCPPDAAMMTAWMVSTLAFGSVQIMQMASPHIAESIVLLLSQASMEVVRSLLYSLYGKTEFGAMLAVGRAIVRRCRAYRAKAKMTRIVPGSDVVVSCQQNSSGNDDTDLQPTGEGCAPNAVALERQRRLVSFVAAANFSDVIEILLVASVFLLAKINPLAGASEPKRPEDTLATMVSALLFEFATDVTVATIVAGRTQGASARYSLGDASASNAVFSMAGASRRILTALATMEAILAVSLRLCPRSKPGTDELLFMGHCAL